MLVSIIFAGVKKSSKLKNSIKLKEELSTELEVKKKVLFSISSIQVWHSLLIVLGRSSVKVQSSSEKVHELLTLHFSINYMSSVLRASQKGETEY